MMAMWNHLVVFSFLLSHPLTSNNHSLAIFYGGWAGLSHVFSSGPSTHHSRCLHPPLLPPHSLTITNNKFLPSHLKMSPSRLQALALSPSQSQTPTLLTSNSSPLTISTISIKYNIHDCIKYKRLKVEGSRIMLYYDETHKERAMKWQNNNHVWRKRRQVWSRVGKNLWLRCENVEGDGRRHKNHEMVSLSHHHLYYSLARTEKCNKWFGVWTTKVYSIDKPNEQGEYGVWNDHTVREDPERGEGGPSLCALRTINDPMSHACVTCDVMYMV